MRRLLIATACLNVFSCGPLTVRQSCEMLREAACRKLYDCRAIGQRELEFCSTLEVIVSDCVSTNDPKEAVRDSRITYDCIDYVKAMDCSVSEHDRFILDACKYAPLP